MSTSCIRNTKGSVGSSTAEPRRIRRVWPGKSLSVLTSSNIDASPLTGRGFSMHRTGQEIMMGQERDYWNDKQSDLEHAQAETGHPNVKSYYHAIRQMVTVKGVVIGAKEHVSMLEMLDARNGDMYYSEKDEFYVDEWSIQTPELYHRHKELGTYITADGMDFQGYAGTECDEVYPKNYKTHIQWDAAKGVCGLCDKHMPGEIMMMHKFYQLP